MRVSLDESERKFVELSKSTKEENKRLQENIKPA